jgi:hypothetical protein
VVEYGGPPRSSTGEGEIGRTQGAIREIGHGDRCLTWGRSSGRLGAVSGELDGRECGSPTAAGGMGRARERVKSSEVRRGVCAGHWRGSKKGSRARGRASWSRNPVTCVSAHSLVHGKSREGGTNKAGPTAQREKRGRAGGNGSALANWARETERERERANGQRKLAPTGRPH